MKVLLNEFRDTYINRLLDILWAQWTTLGVSGQTKTWQNSPVDPEALLLFSATVARYDARLFDAILDWITLNERFINIGRFSRMEKIETFDGKRAFQAMISSAGTSDAGLKWARITKRKDQGSSVSEPFFLFLNGNAIPVVGQPDSAFLQHGFLREKYRKRGITRTFNADFPGNLILKLRAFFGVNARCEIIQFLLLNPSGSPRALARSCYYLPGTINKAMSEMAQSGLLKSRMEGRRRLYTFTHPDTWKSMLIGSQPPLKWIVWPCVFSVLEQILIFLNQHREPGKTDLEIASSLRRIVVNNVEDRLIRSGFPDVPELMKHYTGAELIHGLLETINNLLDWIQPQ